MTSGDENSKPASTATQSLSYRDAGVDIDAGNALVEDQVDAPIEIAEHMPGCGGAVSPSLRIFRIAVPSWSEEE